MGPSGEMFGVNVFMGGWLLVERFR